MTDYDFDSSGLVFTEAARDVDAEVRAELLIRGKIAAAAFWPYLADAASETEFGHRLALVEDRLAQQIPSDVLEPVQASLAADWKLLHTTRQQERQAAAQQRGEQIREHIAYVVAAHLQPDQEFFDQQAGKWVTAANSASGYTLPARYQLPEDLRDNQHAVEGYRDARYHAANGYDWRLADGDSFTLQHQDYQRGYGRAHDDLKAKRTAAKYPHSDDAYLLPDDIHAHPSEDIRDGYRDARFHDTRGFDLREHPDWSGESKLYQQGYVRAHQDMQTENQRNSKHAYIDPSDAQRYSTYPDLNPPVDNGLLQGPDGFVTDPQPDNSGASNAVIQQRQLTPGQWTVTPGTEWPVRPNAGDPTQVPRTAAQLPGHLRAILQTGSPRWEFDALVTAYPHLRAFAGEGIVPTPGPNPNYFSQGSDGLAGPPSFPENPSGQVEPKTDNRMDDLYGAVPPQVSPGSAIGQADGQGYSRQAPGSSATAGRHPFSDSPLHLGGENSQGRSDLLQSFIQGTAAFDRAAGAVGNVDSGGWFTTPRAGYPKAETDCAHTYRTKKGRCKECGYSAADDLNHEDWVRGTFGDKGAERADALLGDNHIGPTRYSSRTAAFDGSHVTHYVGWARSQGKNPDDVATLKAYEREPGVSRGHTNFLADQLYIGGGDSDWRRQGKIAGGFGGTEPTFKRDDRVVDFRGDAATIHRVIPSQDPGKSHRVQVRWDDSQRNLTWDGREHPEGAGDERAYYEQVFSHHPDTVARIGQSVDEAVPHAPGIQRAYASDQGFTIRRVQDAAMRHPDLVDKHCGGGGLSGAGREQLAALIDEADRRDNGHWASRIAATDGRIVGHCDNCRHPVRYHTNEQGVDELRHLHNNDNRCSTGQRAQAGLDRVHAFFDPADPGVIVVTADETRNRPTLDHPSGVSDEFDANTWENALTQRPLQSAQDRHINTPTQAREPIKVIDSSPRDNDLDEDSNQNSMARETSLREIMEMS